MTTTGRVSDSASGGGSTDAAVRRVWVWHALFAVSLLVPTVVTAIDSSVALGPRTATLAIAAVWAALYLTFVQRVGEWDHLQRRDAIGYFVLAIGFAVVLIVRRDVYFLVVYALYPQAFLFLARWRWVGVAAVTGVLAVGALPRLADDDPAATISVIASAATAIAIGYFIEGVHGESRSRGQALDDLGQIHAATEAVAAARSQTAVAAALRTHLGQPTDDVTITQTTPGHHHRLVIPLATAQDDAIVIETAREIPPDEQRRWQAIGPHVAVVLDNLRLVRRARSTGILEERERLAREVHDTLAQSLTSIVTQLEAADQQLPDGLTDVERRIAVAQSSARDGLAAARAFVRNHRPVELVDATLAEAIRHVTDRWSETTCTPVSFHADGSDGSALPPEGSDALLRITQEALANIQQHAAARAVNIAMQRRSDRIILEIHDDGIGFDPQGARARPDGSGFGLSSMQQRAEQAGGTLTVAAQPGTGTTVRVQLPTTGEQPR